MPLVCITTTIYIKIGRETWTHTGRSRNLKLNVKLFHSESAVPQTFIFLTTGAGVLIKTAFLRSYELLPRSQARNGHK